MSKHLTVKQMMRECFCKFFLWEECDCDMCRIPKGLARAARRFCRIEERQKKELERSRFFDECRNKGVKQGAIELPKHFGEMRFKSACRKTTGKGT
jgi:hypothetical protein